MNKTIVICLLTGALMSAAPLGAAQQAKIPRIGILPPGPLSERKHLWEEFKDGLRERGYVEGENIILILPSTDVKRERLAQHAAELVSLKVDIIVAATTVAVRAAKEATKTIPIVAPIVGDPVEAGLVASLARPGGNVTGVTLPVQLSGKRLELLREVVFGVSRVAVLSNPSSSGSPIAISETTAAARALGIQLHRLDVRHRDDFEQAFAAATKERAGALMTLDDALVFTHRNHIVKLAAKNRLPAIYGFREFVDDGGLMYYGARVGEMYRRAATYVDKILKGANPGDLPVEQPTTYDFVVNLKTAKQLGLTIPPDVLARANRVIR